MWIFILWGTLVMGDATLYSHGVIYTLNPEQPQASSMLVQDGRIAWVGEEDSASIPEDASRVDLQGSVVLPGLIDAHAHLVSLGAALERLDLRPATSFEDLVAMVKKAADVQPAGAWVLGRGWDQNDWPEKALPHHQALSDAVPDHPVCLYRIDGHAAILNQKAMDRLGLSDQQVDPPGGKFHRDETGLTGVLIDNAMNAIQLPQPSLQQLEHRILLAAKHMARNGLTGVHDAGVDAFVLTALENLARRGALPIRVYAMLGCEDLPWTFETMEQKPRLNLYDGFLTVRAVKMFADGALGSRGAWLKEDYTDEPGQRGLQLTDDRTMERVLDAALKHGFQVCTHAIGDQANAWVLQHYGRAFDRHDRGERFRIEHAQILDPADMPQIKELGVIPSMQPTHCTSDMPWAPDRLGQARLKGAYAWRSLLDLGLPIPCGSDAPVEEVNPFEGIYAAITRQDKAGNPPGGFFPSLCMTREEAVKGFTTWAAYAAFQEDQLGSLEKGKRADFVVVDRDIFCCEVPAILGTTVLRTVVDGRAVWISE